MVLYLHLSDAGLIAPDEVGRAERTRVPVLARTIRDWCRDEGTRVTVRPVLDLEAPLHADCYEINDTIRDHVVLRDGACTFPFCRADARTGDIDHVIPYEHEHPTGGRGPTDTRNLAALCRHHHRLKTHEGWASAMPAPGVLEWTSPMGLRYRRDRDGATSSLDPP